MTDFFDSATLADPYGYYGAQREDATVIDVSRSDREVYLVIGAAAINEVTAQPEIFSSRPSGVNGPNQYPRAEERLRERGFGRAPQVIVMDPPRHTAYRKVMGRLLRERRMHLMRAEVRAVANQLVDEWGPAGQCEFVMDYAWKLSILVIADLLGVERARINDFKRWANAWVLPLLRDLSEPEMIECVDAIAELQHYLAEQIEERRRSPREDLLTDIATATIDLGQGEVELRRHEQLGICEALIVAGNDSTANALSFGMLRLIEFPAIADRIRGDRRSIERFAEESLRYEAAIQNNFRTVAQDTEFHGVPMGKGAQVLLSWGAANRDAAVFENPGTFDIDRRSTAGHYGFGRGIHMCAGAALARQELVESYEVLLSRLGHLRMQPGHSVEGVARVGGIVTHGLASLPIAFDLQR